MEGRKISILMIVPTLSAGGSEKIMSFLANHLNRERFTIHFCVLDAKDPFYKVDTDHVTLIDLHTKHARHAILKIFKIIRKIKPDIVFSTLGHLNILVAMLKPFLSRKIKFIARESVIPSLAIKYSWNPRLFGFLTARFYKRFHLIICQSRYMQMDLVKNFNIPMSKTIVINNPVTIPKDKVEIGAKDEKYFHLLSVGRLAKEKGYDRILKALKNIQQQYYYHIIGTGPEFGTLTGLVKKLGLEEKVLFHGNIADPFKKYGYADLVLMGSYYEGFPNVLLDAGMYQIPVVAFNAPGGINEIIIDGFNGFLVKDNAIENYSAAIEKALVFNFEKENILKYISETFNPGTILSAYEQSFADLLEL